MLVIEFKGWFQCRLATDPDAYDEPRGVSGHVHAYAGEPDLDRVLYWQPPAFSRVHAPTVGVAVSAVTIDSIPVTGAALLGAPLTLNGAPKFEGRNKVIARDGFEPIYPFDLEIAQAGITVRRAVVPFDHDYPFEGLLSAGVDTSGASEIQQATGIQSLAKEWTARLDQLKAIQNSPEPEATARRERIAFLEKHLSLPPTRSTLKFFVARMHYALLLTSSDPVVAGVAEQLGFQPDLREPWPVRFWLGGWDADVLCGFCSGRLIIPRKAQPVHRGGAPLPPGVRRDEI